MPKILLLDIETAPSLGFYFDLWKEGNIIETRSDWFILSFAYKWLGERRVTVRALPDFPSYKRDLEDDRSLCRELHTLLSEADICVAHNGDRFDLPKICARLVVHGFQPPTPYKSIDTLKIARKHFRFDSNRLDALARYLKIGKKLPTTGVHMWRGCMLGDKKAWKRMRRYNAHDVELLEGVYLKLRPWASTHPNLSHYTRDPIACPTCESHRTQRRGFRPSATGKRQLCQCTACGHCFVHGPLIKLDRV